MPTTIAIAGKGGTGKTAISALLINFLAKHSPPVLGVDGDPATNLHIALGLPLDDQTNTIGGIREYMEHRIYQDGFDPGIPKQEWLDAKMREGLVEAKGLDLLAMGRSEGPGCYCAVNHMLRSTLSRLSKPYRFVVIDNEAGMEHISRQTTTDVDTLLLISNPTVPGVLAAARTQKLVRELRNKVRRIYLILNRVTGELPPNLKDLIKEGGMELTETIPEDPYMEEFEAEGRPIIELPEDSPLRRGALEILTKLRFVSERIAA
ncbi:MAG: AAA family ATPase [Deltaproteobacteria bacterium]|nr:AAA family ATPase [Deltaproteobacteria bacterium]